MKKSKNLPLLRNLIYSLVLFGKIRTTKARAKAIVGLVDRLVNKLKKGTVASKRDVLRVLPQKQIIEKLTGEIIPKLTGKSGGYTTIVKIGERAGDGAPMVVMEWVKSEQKLETGSEKLEPKAKKPKKGKDVKTNKNK